MHIIFAQIFGKVLVRLCCPKSSEQMYPMSGALSYISQVDGEYPDFEKFPRFADVEVFEVVMCPSDLLFIPRGWWYMVKNLSPAISIHFRQQ
ncbi:unnamed protein product [Caenorhabditis bovis]|nr:unnamed protein product [Caenorhabditis bovis]